MTSKFLYIHYPFNVDEIKALMYFEIYEIDFHFSTDNITIKKVFYLQIPQIRENIRLLLLCQKSNSLFFCLPRNLLFEFIFHHYINETYKMMIQNNNNNNNNENILD